MFLVDELMLASRPHLITTMCNSVSAFGRNEDISCVRMYRTAGIQTAAASHLLSRLKAFSYRDPSCTRRIVLNMQRAIVHGFESDKLPLVFFLATSPNVKNYLANNDLPTLCTPLSNQRM